MTSTKRPFAVIYRFRGSPRVRVWTTYATRNRAQRRVEELEKQGWIAWVEDRS